jgi:alpha-mannosidase
LDLLKNDPDFLHFTFDGQTAVFEDYLEAHPEQEPTLQYHMQAGRLLIDPWYILPDEFLVSLEASEGLIVQGYNACTEAQELTLWLDRPLRVM